ncbi:MFS transporter [Arthrobacter sp. Leaf137]|uniref:MFS transporter n=1 Tax=Arthrobacter sp. Leaf137 TaxID=1736271 RepID=UPI002570D91F|nr:MFS transporter [Arthrobacter sp. Leaf137]
MASSESPPPSEGPASSGKDARPGSTALPEARLRRARIGVALLFLTNGALFANLLPRYPAIMDELHLSNAQFGMAVAAFPLGALVAGLGAAALIRRFGSAAVAVLGTVLTGAGVLAAGVAPSWALLAGALFAAGAADAITDVAQNSHGLRVQRLYGRSILNSFHAVWSIGAVLGGLMGAGAILAGLSRGLHLGLSCLVFAAVALAASRLLLPGHDPAAAAQEAQATGTAKTTGRPPLKIWAILAALVLIAVSGSLVEDAGSTWAAVYLSGSLGAAASLAALGYVSLTGAQFVGRLVGDRLVDRFGQRAVARCGGVIVLAGMGCALAWPTVPGTIAGFAAAGLGVATLVPAAMHTADELPGLRHGTGLTLVSWLMRLGFLCSPPVVGLIADATSVRTGLLVVPLAGVLVLFLAQVLPPRRGVLHLPKQPRPGDQASVAGDPSSSASSTSSSSAVP